MDHSNVDFAAIRRCQEETAKKVIATDTLDVEPKYICGIDVSYKDSFAYCSAAIIEKDSLNAIESANSLGLINQPYIPGLFVLKEYGPIINTLRYLKSEFHILLIDGNGRLHPRKCGLACYVGIKINKPTIGVAKSLLCGFVREDSFVEFDGDIVGFEIITNRKKRIYVSIGHKVSLTTAVNIVNSLTKACQWIPEPLRVAHINSRDYANFSSYI